MTKQQAIQQITNIILSINDMPKNNVLRASNRSTTNHERNTIRATILEVYPPKKSVSAIHYRYAKKMIHFKDYKTNSEKQDCLNILEKLKPFRDECLLNMKICTKQHPQPLYVHCYSASKYCDVPHIKNLAEYVSDNFNNGNVVQLKVVRNNLFTGIKKLADNNIE